MEGARQGETTYHLQSDWMLPSVRVVQQKKNGNRDSKQQPFRAGALGAPWRIASKIEIHRHATASFFQVQISTLLHNIRPMIAQPHSLSVCLFQEENEEIDYMEAGKEEQPHLCVDGHEGVV